MKISSLAFLGFVLITVIPGQVMADSATPPSPDNATSDAPAGQRGERLKATLAQLNLSDAQKEQIKQIFQTVTDRKERRHQISAVLTPDQKAKFKQLMEEHHKGNAPASTPAPATS